MADVQPLNDADLQAALQTLANWQVRQGKLHGEFRFGDFVEAFAFMTKVAFAAEAAGHHPEWSNIFNRVTIDLMTHDAGNAISQRDVDLAQQINQFAEK